MIAKLGNPWSAPGRCMRGRGMSPFESSGSVSAVGGHGLEEPMRTRKMPGTSRGHWSFLLGRWWRGVVTMAYLDLVPRALWILGGLVGTTGVANAKSPLLWPPRWLGEGTVDTLHVGDLHPGSSGPCRVVERDGLVWERISEERWSYGCPAGVGGVRIPVLEIDGNARSLLVHVARRRLVSFRHRPGVSAERVTVFGTMNNWNRTRSPLADGDGDGVWQGEMWLEPGNYDYKYWVDGAEVLDAEGFEQVPNGFGGFNSRRRVEPLESGREARLRFAPDDGSSDLLILVTPAVPFSEVSAESLIVLLNNDRIHPQVRTLGDRWAISLAEIPAGDHSLRLLHRSGSSASNVLRADLENGRWAGTEGPRRWEDRILYSLMVDRFSNGNRTDDAPVSCDSLGFAANWQGGDLSGVRDRIEGGWFERLGVGALWLSPIYRAPGGAFREHPPPHRLYTGYHGYWPVEPRRVEPRFGTLADLRSVVDAAHARDIRVLLDLVSNHVHEEHVYRRDHPDWFGPLAMADGTLNLRRFDEERLTTWFEPYLPSFDYLGAPAAIDTMVADAVWWLRATGADGFRHDATKHVPARYWRRLTTTLRDSLPELDLFQIGETFGDDELLASFIGPGQQDAQFDFASFYTVREVLLDPERSFAEVAERMERVWKRFGPGHGQGNLMGSHDQVRFVTLADGDLDSGGADAREIGWSNPPTVDDASSRDLAAVFWAWIMGTPGTPVLYYGDEIGLAGAGDPDNRRFMRFGQDLSSAEEDYLEQVALWSRLRANSIALRRGDFEVLAADERALAWLRVHPLERLVVVLSRGDAPRHWAIPLPPGIGRSGAARDMMSGASLGLDGHGRLLVELPPVGARVISLAP